MRGPTRKAVLVPGDGSGGQREDRGHCPLVDVVLGTWKPLEGFGLELWKQGCVDAPLPAAVWSPHGGRRCESRGPVWRLEQCSESETETWTRDTSYGERGRT